MSQDNAKGNYFNVEIVCSERPDSCSVFSLCSDEVKLDAGDFSDERLEALVADSEKKIRKMWAYMKDRQTA